MRLYSASAKCQWINHIRSPTFAKRRARISHSRQDISLTLKPRQHIIFLSCLLVLCHHQTMKIGIVGFGPFAQFLAKTMIKQGHSITASSRSDYSEVCKHLGVASFYRYKKKPSLNRLSVTRKKLRM